jgi:hypothetical protein
VELHTGNQGNRSYSLFYLRTNCESYSAVKNGEFFEIIKKKDFI